MRTPQDLARELRKVLDTIEQATNYLELKGQADATSHLAPQVRYNPLTVAMQSAEADLSRLIGELEEGVTS